MSMGTHTLENEPNYLMIAQVQLPLEHFEFNIPDVDGFGFVNTNKVKIIQYINHDGEGNRAQYMPQNALIIAIKVVSAEVNVFDYSKHASELPLRERKVLIWFCGLPS
ncbi:hypothetical protein K1719_000556 [Acacia pycnantha]|nr:hypothetical protein K1719_000556 [Acacia pycnantha]